MYDIKKKKQFETVGDLKALLKDIPDETKIVVTGDDYCWFHIEQDGSVICLDVEELDDAYDDGTHKAPCDYGECHYDAQDSADCRYFCGLGVDEDKEYVPSAENGDYGPSNPWDAPGGSIDMFIRGVQEW